MAMSKDRVRFVLPASYLHNRSTIELVNAIFGLKIQFPILGLGIEDEVIIICRPSQFARFLILRNNAGLRNGFKELCAELFIPEPECPIKLYDASKNPANEIEYKNQPRRFG